jgi:hypothetical protein
MVAIDPEKLDRTQKLLLDTGDATTPEEAAEIFSRYVLQVDITPGGLEGPTAEAAFATILNASPRAFQGAVRVRLAEDATLKAGWLAGRSASEAIEAFGCERVTSLSDDFPTLVLGPPANNWPTRGPCLGVTYAGWSGGVLSRPGQALSRHPEFPPTGVLAAAIGVSEAFQIIRGNARAGHRDHGLSLWRPDMQWINPAAFGPDFRGLLAPNKIHFVGLGHLGQAYLWTLGWLPFAEPTEVDLVLQDVDCLTEANLSTSLLATRAELGQPKTRFLAAKLEERGYHTRLIERRLDEHHRATEDEPRAALIGVDNPMTRALLGNAGWQLIIDVGLGAGPGNYLDAQMHSFPARVTPAELWGGRRGSFDATLLDQPAYRKLERSLGDPCGAIMVAGRAVGAAFVGAFASAVAVSELVRYYADDAARFEVLNLSLRDLSAVRCVATSDWQGGENLGMVGLE